MCTSAFAQAKETQGKTEEGAVTTRTFSPKAWSLGQRQGGPQAKALDDNFKRWFPEGIVLGDQDGPDSDESFSLLLKSPRDLRILLQREPNAPSRTRERDRTGPKDVVLGSLGRQLLAVKLNLAYDRDVKKSGLGGFVFGEGVMKGLRGRRLDRLVALADRVYSSELAAVDRPEQAGKLSIDIDGDRKPDMSVTQLADSLRAVNLSFSNGHR